MMDRPRDDGRHTHIHKGKIEDAHISIPHCYFSCLISNEEGNSAFLLKYEIIMEF